MPRRNYIALCAKSTVSNLPWLIDEFTIKLKPIIKKTEKEDTLPYVLQTEMGNDYHYLKENEEKDGRIMSRNKAKDSISIEAFQQSMESIFSTSVCPNTIDESPLAYKDTQEIISLIEPTCLIEYFMRPVINIKDTSDYRG